MSEEKKEANAKVGPHLPACPCYENDPDDAKPIPPIGPPAKWDKEADIVVVGSGGGGFPATARAAEAGDKVICLEKMPDLGGTAGYASAFRCWGSKRWHEPAGYKWDKEEVLKDFYERETHWSSDLKMNRMMLEKAQDCIEWFADTPELGVDWQIVDALPHYVWAPAPPEHPTLIHCTFLPVIKRAEKYVEKLGGEWLKSTACSKLVQDKGRIIGVEGTTLDGDQIYVKAKKAVILAAGGMQMNRNMLKRWIPTAYRCVGAVTMSMPSCTGECIRMAQGVGADMDGLDSFQTFDGGIDLLEVGGPWFRFIYSGDVTLARQGFLQINQGCERFMHVDNRGDHMHWRGHPQMAQAGGRSYMIFDADYEEDVWKFKGELDRFPTTKDMPQLWPKAVADMDWTVGVKEAIDMGAIKVADTLEELAEKMGLDPQKLVAVVNRYNSYVDQGYDPEFDKPPYLLSDIRKPPFYGLKQGSGLGPTECGVRVNLRFQVLDAAYEPIPGLYATFFTAGGAEGQSNCGGTAILSCVGSALTSGYIAGAEASKENPWC